MQVIQVSNTAQDLCDKLAAAAVPGFFDTVEMASGSTTTVECKKNGTTIFKIANGSVVTCTFPNGESYPLTKAGSGLDYIGLLVTTSKAIYMTNYLGNSACVVIAKDTDGDLAVISTIYNNQIVAINGTEKTSPISIFKEDGSVIVRNYAFNNNNTTKKSYFIPTFVNDAKFVDGVYMALVRPYPNEPGYMPFTVGSAQYVGFDGTSFVVQDS